MVRRTLGCLVVLVAMALAAPPAEAGIGGLIRAAVKAGGKAGSKAGAKAGTKAGAVGAKAGAKGAAAAGTAVAAQGVFAGSVDDVGRLGVYVADKGDGTFSAITRAGDDLAAGSDDIARTFDDVANAADDIELDVFVDRSAVGRLDDLDVGEGTRLYLADADGGSLPLRRGMDGPEVELDEGLWMDLAKEAGWATFDLAVEVGQQSAGLIDTVWPIDPDCDDDGVQASLGAALSEAAPAQTVVAVTAQPTPDGATVRALAKEAGVDLVVLQVSEVCGVDGQVSAETSEVIARVHAAESRADLWSANRGSDDGQRIVGERFENDELTLAGVGIAASHGTEEPPAWAKAMAMCLVCGCPTVIFVGMAGMLVMFVRRKR
ncbi:MAG: hypothetical protein KTR31_26530 [Myxococcales bacterium]|nr:hypothetical protein [Myxococcales bacterium]